MVAVLRPRPFKVHLNEKLDSLEVKDKPAGAPYVYDAIRKQMVWVERGGEGSMGLQPVLWRSKDVTSEGVGDHTLTKMGQPCNRKVKRELKQESLLLPEWARRFTVPETFKALTSIDPHYPRNAGKLSKCQQYMLRYKLWAGSILHDTCFRAQARVIGELRPLCFFVRWENFLLFHEAGWGGGGR